METSENKTSETPTPQERERESMHIWVSKQLEIVQNEFCTLNNEIQCLHHQLLNDSHQLLVVTTKKLRTRKVDPFKLDDNQNICRMLSHDS